MEAGEERGRKADASLECLVPREPQLLRLSPSGGRVVRGGLPGIFREKTVALLQRVDDAGEVRLRKENVGVNRSRCPAWFRGAGCGDRVWCMAHLIDRSAYLL